MKVSIITSVFNNEETIEETLNSVLSQDYDDIEYIVIDGASTDRTCEIVKKYLDYIDVFISEPDKGIYDGLNKGIKVATGDIISFLHSDDIFYDKTTITEVVSTFQHYNTDSVYGDLVYIDKKDPNKIVRYWKSGRFSKKKLKYGWMPPHPSLFVKKHIYEKFGIFDTSFKIAADYDVVLRFFGVANISTVYVEKVFVKMRTGGESNRDIKNLLKKTMEDYKAMKKNNIGGIYSLTYKNISKIPQFLDKNVK